jgi:hypothetical protein
MNVCSRWLWVPMILAAMAAGCGTKTVDSTLDWDTTPPAGVTGFTAVAGDSQVSLSWTNPGEEDFAGVMVRRSTTVAPNLTNGVLVYDGNSMSCMDDNLDSDTIYYYSIFAYDSIPNYSPGASLSSTADVTPPGNVSAFAATPTGPTIDLAWTNPGDTDFAGVMIRRSTTSFPATWVDGTLVFDGAVEAYSDTGLSDGLTYYYSAFTYDEIPNPSSASTAQATIDISPPAIVTDFTAAQITTGISLSWTNPGDADFQGTIIRRSDTGAPTGPTDGDPVYDGTDETVDDMAVSHGVTYYYAAFTYDERPNYSTGTQVIITVDISAPAEVSGFAATAGRGQISLAWTNPGDLDFAGVIIRRSDTGAPATPNDGTPVYNGTGQSHIDSPLTVGTTYYYTAFTFDGVPNISSGAGTQGIPYDAYAVGWIGGGQNGWQITSGSTSSNAYQSFNSPCGVFVDGSGNIYVADTVNNRVSKWDGSGNAVGWIGGGTNGWKTGSGAAYGTGYQSFGWPRDVFVDSSGNIYVVEQPTYRVSKWDSTGNAIGWIGGGLNGWQTGSAPSAGATDYQSFDQPSGLYVDVSGNIYVAEYGNHRVSKWDSSGNAVGWIGGGLDGWNTGAGASAGSAYKSLNGAYGVHVAGSGDIYIADLNNNRVSKWNSSGNAVGWIGGGLDGWQTGSGASASSSYKSFDWPIGAFLDSSGNIFVADYYNNRVCKWNSSGNAQGWIGGGRKSWQTGFGATAGSDYQSLDTVARVFVDSSGNIYVADAVNHRISKWNE